MEDTVIYHPFDGTNNQSKPEIDNSVLEIWGGESLKGQVQISGAKNSALVIMAGSLLCPSDCRISNIPTLADIACMSQILQALGVKIEKQGNTLEINARDITQSEAPYELVSQMRASFFAIGPLLTRLGVASIPLPGGCAIGARPIDLHVKGLQAMGAEIRIESGMVYACVKGKNKRLKGANIYLDYPSVGATETIMMAATLADGETRIDNAAREPEVVDLANFCRSMGAKIEGAGTNTITISGVESLHSTDYRIVPDRIEAGTFLIAGAITGSELSVFPVIAEHLTATIAKLSSIGARVITEGPDCLRILPGVLKGTDIETLPYPGFPTDMQAQFMALLAISEGNSLISETVFENRMHHVAELNRMGADIRIKGNHAFVKGMPFLSGVPVKTTDLRGSAALVLAGLAARGKTVIQGLHHLDRGYENIEGKLQKLGAKIERVIPQTEAQKFGIPIA